MFLKKVEMYHVLLLLIEYMYPKTLAKPYLPDKKFIICQNQSKWPKLSFSFRNEIRFLLISKT